MLYLITNQSNCFEDFILKLGGDSTHSPWQRGTNENTNGLVRGFFPKGTDFNLVTKEKLNWVQNALNERPRQTLEFNTPKETFNSLLLKY